jgi:hypothetical protein
MIRIGTRNPKKIETRTTTNNWLQLERDLELELAPKPNWSRFEIWKFKRINQKNAVKKI